MQHIAHSRAITPITDPVHGTLTFTPFEREIIDGPYFQRLHFILQNSVSFSAYPNNKVSRFIHSLGVGHVAGWLFQSSVSNASTADLNSFLSATALLIEEGYVLAGALGTPDANFRTLVDGWSKSISGRSEFAHHPFLPDDGAHVMANDCYAPGGEKETGDGAKEVGKRVYPALFLVDTLWQVGRICGLLHDIGHLPMSHSFEGALQQVPNLYDCYNCADSLQEFESPMRESTKHFLDARNEIATKHFEKQIVDTFGENRPEAVQTFFRQLPVHERRSLLIASSLRETDKFKHEADVIAYRNMIFRLSHIVLVSSIQDYTLEDGGSGSERTPVPAVLRYMKEMVASEIDADRLDYVMRDGISSNPSFGHYDLDRIVSNSVLSRPNERSYRCAFYYRSISAIEQFFAQRRDGYKYLIYHRTSARTEAALQDLISRTIFLCCENPDSRIADVFENFGFIHRDKSLQKVTDIIPADEKTLKRLDDASLRCCFLQIHDEAQNDVVRQRLKDQEQLDILCALIEVVFVREYKHVFSPFKHETIKAKLRRLLADKFDDETYKEVIKSFMRSIQYKDFILKLKKSFYETFGNRIAPIGQVILPKYYDETKVSEEDRILIIDGEKKLKDVAEFSSFLKDMPRKFLKDFDFRVYFVGDSIKFDGQLIASANELLDQHMQSFCDRVLEDSMPERAI